jgi:hypothetical protein
MRLIRNDSQGNARRRGAISCRPAWPCALVAVALALFLVQTSRAQDAAPANTSKGHKAADKSKGGKNASDQRSQGERKQIGSEPPVRNAIGLPVPAHPAPEANATRVAVPPPAPSGPASSNVTTGTPKGVAPANRPPANTGLPANTVNRTGINGTGINRPGSGPGTIGGAAKNTAGIGGSSFRPKQ